MRRGLWAEVVWQAEGGMLEEFVNRLQQSGVPITQIRRQGERLIAVTPAAEYHRLRPAARRTGTRVRVIQKKGLAFRLLPYRGRVGLPVGIAAAVALLLFLSSRIWVVTLNGLEGSEATEALATVSALGVAVGQPIAALQPHAISLEALRQLDEVISLTVNMDGCIAHVEVVKDISHHPEESEIVLSNLVAARDGLIVSTQIEQGTRMVKVGEGVVAGTLLACGAMETTTAGPLLGRAEGVVLAETHRRLAVEVPLVQTVWRPSGAAVTATTLSFFGLTLPLSASRQLADPATLTVDRDFLTVEGITLPVGVIRRTATPLAAQEITLSEQQAAVLARQQLAAQELEQLGEAEIEERTVAVTLADGVYALEAAYVCIENIAVEVPVTVM